MRRVGIDPRWLGRTDPVRYFRRAMRTELEHGRVNRRTDVTHDGALKTAQIVAAHLLGVEHGRPRAKWVPFKTYYDHLWAMERANERRHKRR